MSAIRDRILAGEPATGTISEAMDWIVESFQQWTPDQKEQFRRETMQRVYHDLAQAEWEREHPDRPYDSELKN